MEIILSKYLTEDDFYSEEELEVYNSLLCQADPKAAKGFVDIFDDFMNFEKKHDPVWENTLHENIFGALFPFLERQVVIGVGKGGYKKYGVKKYTLDFFHSEDGVAWEIDGESHGGKIQAAKDLKRDLILEKEFGIETYRLSNEDVERLLLKRIRDRKVVEKNWN